jgi:hypothetical protein
MLAPGSFAPGEAVGLPAIVKHQRADQALVSFSYVRPGSPGHSRPCRRRSQTATTRGEHRPTDLESVLGATPQEFESLILRHVGVRLRLDLVRLRCLRELRRVAQARLASSRAYYAALGSSSAIPSWTNRATAGSRSWSASRRRASTLTWEATASLSDRRLNSP